MSIRKIRYYVTKNGKSPFLSWINKQDIQHQIIVNRLLQRVAQGGAKKSIKNLKDGVFEIKAPQASGLRIYFGEDEDRIILLLIGGNKGTQKRDIAKAKTFWRNYGKSTQKL